MSVVERRLYRKASAIQLLADAVELFCLKKERVFKELSTRKPNVRARGKNGKASAGPHREEVRRCAAELPSSEDRDRST